MTSQKVGETISRLAVVAKDFSTYYIPGHTMIGDKQVNQIAEIGDEYHVLDYDGNRLASIQKSAPCVVEWTDVYEVPEDIDPDFISDEMYQMMINFGNFLFKKHEVYVMDEEEEKRLYLRVVTDADLANWKHLLTENTK